MAAKASRSGGKDGRKGGGQPAAGDGGGVRCGTCGAAAVADAKFCHQCGAQLGETLTVGSRVLPVALLGGLAAVVFAVVVALAFLLQPESFETRQAAPRVAGPAAPSTQSSVDLSEMTPREAADRLFNRVMAADERGDVDEARQFAPKALEAYARVARLDADAEYHLGLLYAVTGDLDGLRRQIAALRKVTPTHLLAYTLEHQLARMTGDDEAAARAVAGLRANYEAEIATGRPEYDIHGVSIVQLLPEVPAVYTDSAESGAARRAAREALSAGAGLFASRCAGCHGLDGNGTDKGPPLVHKVYEPSHHGDEAFRLAVRQGVRAHHWDFGDMPPVSGLSDGEITAIVAHVRGLQEAAGIR